MKVVVFQMEKVGVCTGSGQRGQGRDSRFRSQAVGWISDISSQGRVTRRGEEEFHVGNMEWEVPVDVQVEVASRHLGSEG